MEASAGASAAGGAAAAGDSRRGPGIGGWNGRETFFLEIIGMVNVPWGLLGGGAVQPMVFRRHVQRGVA